MTQSSALPAQASVWSSRDACERALERGQRAPRTAGHARIGTWNVRWFPDGRPGKRVQRPGTDIAWLACAITWLDVDALLVQEFKAHPAALERLAELLRGLDARSGGQWRSALDDCPNRAGQHVGVLYDARRVTARDFRSFAALNGHGEACKDQLRPGFGGYLRFAGGLDLFAVSVHLKSGPERRSFTLRQRAFAGLTRAYREALSASADTDVLIGGDFNTMGCAQCSPPIVAETELSELSQRLAQLPEPFRRVPNEPGCSYYVRGKPSLLDQFVVSAATRELGPAQSAQVFGDCGERACEPLHGPRGAAAERLSDHCPVVVELADRDLDAATPSAR